MCVHPVQQGGGFKSIQLWSNSGPTDVNGDFSGTRVKPMRSTFENGTPMRDIGAIVKTRMESHCHVD